MLGEASFTGLHEGPVTVFVFLNDEAFRLLPPRQENGEVSSDSLQEWLMKLVEDPNDPSVEEAVGTLLRVIGRPSLDPRVIFLMLLLLDPIATTAEKHLFGNAILPKLFNHFSVDGVMTRSDLRTLVSFVLLCNTGEDRIVDLEITVGKIMEEVTGSSESRAVDCEYFDRACVQSRVETLMDILKLKPGSNPELRQALFAVRVAVAGTFRFQPTLDDVPKDDTTIYLSDMGARFSTMQSAVHSTHVYSKIGAKNPKYHNFERKEEYFSDVERVSHRFLKKTVCSSSQQWEELSMSVAQCLNLDEIMLIIHTARAIFESESTVVDVRMPCKTFGDLHGHIEDLFKLFRVFGTPSHLFGDIRHMNYVFIGDFVDRGKHGLEVVLTLFSLKILYPHAVHLIRGNHEDEGVNLRYGFYNECDSQFPAHGREIYNSINETFSYLPLAAVIVKKVFCVHGGIGMSLRRIEDLKALKKPIFVPSSSRGSLTFEQQLVVDALWSDPTELMSITGVKRNDLRSSHPDSTITRFGVDVVDEFFETNKKDGYSLELIIRGHQVPADGMDVFGNGKLITITSARNYHSPAPSNPAAMLLLTWMSDEDEGLRPQEREIRVEPRFLGGNWSQMQAAQGQRSVDRSLTPLRFNSYLFTEDEASDHKFMSEARLDVEKARDMFVEALDGQPVLRYEQFQKFMTSHGIQACYTPNYFRAFLGRNISKEYLSLSNFLCGLCCMISAIEESNHIFSTCWTRRMQFIFTTYDLRGEKRLTADIKHLIRHALRAAGEPHTEECINKWKGILFQNGKLNHLDFDTFLKMMGSPDTRLPGINLICRFPGDILKELVLFAEESVSSSGSR